MKRSEFLKTIAATGASIAVLGPQEGAKVMAQDSAKDSSADLVAVVGGEPDVMFQKAIAEFGGMGRFVAKGNKVVIKPNIGWDKSPESGANTNPTLVAEMIKQALAAGAAEVLVFDHTCDDWKKAYKTSGIEDAVLAAGGKIIPGNNESDYREVKIPNGVILKSAKIHSAILDCDVWFNVPVLKSHGGAKMTISMKNYMGIVWDRGIFHSTKLQQCIADCCTYVKRPALNVVDAYRVMKAGGPRGGDLSNTVIMKGLLISKDIVAVDTAAVKFALKETNVDLDAVAHIELGEKLKIGTMNLESLNVKRIRV